jgi:site-specific DNA recombinase
MESSTMNPFLQTNNSSPMTRILVLGRLSKPKSDAEATQNTMDASCEFVEQMLRHKLPGKLKFMRLQEQISGLVTKRHTIRKARRLIRRNRVQIVACEDLSRVFRNPAYQYKFVQFTQDHNVRFIAINDGLDTANNGWETLLGAAALKHGTYISDLRYRLQRTMVHSVKQGGFVTRYPFGYRKLTKAESNSGKFGPVGLRIAKIPELTPILRKMVEELQETKSYAAVARWCQANEVVRSDYQREPWTGRMVRQLLANPLLYGLRVYCLHQARRMSNGTVQRRLNPQPLENYYAELAHFSEAEWQEIQQLLESIRQCYLRRNKSVGGCTARGRNRPFPYCITVCGVCGLRLYSYGNCLKCRRKEQQASCWNRVQISGQLLTEKVLDWLSDKLQQIPDLHELIQKTILLTIANTKQNASSQQQQLQEQMKALQTKMKRLTKMLDDQHESVVNETISQSLQQLGKEYRKYEKHLQKITPAVEQIASCSANNPEELAQHWPQLLKQLIHTTPALTRFLKHIIPRIEIQPIQAIDSGKIYPRVKVHFQPGPATSATEPPHREIIELDFFKPSAHYQFRVLAVQLREQQPELSLVKMGKLLGTSYQTVHRALILQQQMLEAGLTEPYIVLVDKPEHAAHWQPRKTPVITLAKRQAS